MVPSTPTNLDLSPEDSYMVITWDAPVSNGGYPILNYTLYRGTNPGNESFLVQIGNVLLFNDTDVSNEITYYYRVMAINTIGLGASSITINGTPEAQSVPINQPPNCSITYPSSGVTIRGTINITGVASDIDGIVQKVEIRIGEGDWIVIEGTISWSFILNTTILSDDIHKISVRSFDGQNHSVESSIEIEVDNIPSEKGRSLFEDLGFWMIIILILMIFIILITLLRKKRTSSPEEITEEIEEENEEPEKPSEEDLEQDSDG